MTTDQTKSDRAVSRRRRMIAVLAVFLMATLGGVLSATEQIALNGGRLVDQFRVGAFVFLAFAFLVFLLTGGRAARRDPALDDELARANRMRAVRLGYGVLMVALIGVYVASLLLPVDVAKLLPLFIGGGIAIPALRFAVLERVGVE